jgi:hypothetical protein
MPATAFRELGDSSFQKWTAFGSCWYVQIGGELMNLTIELPETVWCALQEAAKSSGVTPAGWIASHLPATNGANGTNGTTEDDVVDDLEPPSYTSLPLERVGTFQAVCIGNRELPPLPFPVEELSE